MEFRSIVEWTTADYPSAVELGERISDYVEANELETLVFEWFGNEDTGRVVWYQVYASEEAFLVHAQNMLEAGFRTELQELFTMDRLLLLTPPTLPQTQEMAGQTAAEEVSPIAGVVREPR